MMAEIHEDFGELYTFSDHSIGDTIYYRWEGKTEHGEIIWVACARTLPSGAFMPPHYLVANDKGGWPDSVFFGDVVLREETDILEPCPYCYGYHRKGTVADCPLNPERPRNTQEEE